MNKHLNLYIAVRIVVFFETIFCTIATLCVLMVNGFGDFSADHLLLFLLVAVTIASSNLLKFRKPVYYKTILWMSLLPLLLISFEVIAALLPYKS